VPVRLLITAVALFALVAGCAKSVPGTALPAPGDVAPTSTGRPSASKPVIPSNPRSSTSSTSGSDSGSGDVSVADLAGNWEGTYTCGQGETGLKLAIGQPDATGSAEVTFTFFPLATNSAAASGSYAMRLGQSGGQFKFTQDHWIDQPEGYQMVDLLVQGSPSKDRISGQVVDPACASFTVTRK
jgi:hypothetical protein